MDLTYFLTALASFFAIMNPIANTPIFLGLSADASPKERVAMALKSVALAWLIIALFSATGQYIFQLFGISIGAFRIAGGLLIALVGYHMLQGKMSSVSHSKTSKTPQHEQAASDEETVPSTNDSWVSPLAIPILAGPGSIATAMSLSSHVPIRQFIATQSAIADYLHWDRNHLPLSRSNLWLTRATNP